MRKKVKLTDQMNIEWLI